MEPWFITIVAVFCQILSFFWIAFSENHLGVILFAWFLAVFGWRRPWLGTVLTNQWMEWGNEQNFSPKFGLEGSGERLESIWSYGQEQLLDHWRFDLDFQVISREFLNIYDSKSAVAQVTCHRADAEALIQRWFSDWIGGSWFSKQIAQVVLFYHFHVFARLVFWNLQIADSFKN